MWSIRFLQPSRHHFLFMCYLTGLPAVCEWLAPHRLGFAMCHETPEDLAGLRNALIEAARAMVAHGWWAPAHEVGLSTSRAIKAKLLWEVVLAGAETVHTAMRTLRLCA